MGIEPEKLSTAKRLDQYGKFNAKALSKEEREDILYCVRYVLSNGAANHSEDTVVPLLKEYRDQFVKSHDDEQLIGHLFEAVEYGGNIWRLKRMKDSEIADLFGSVCRKQIVLPQDLAACILSFVVL